MTSNNGKEVLEKTCPKCGTVFPTTNSRKIYCSPKCNKNAYMSRRYERDSEFNKRMRSCWREYGTDICPKCGRGKRKSDKVCLHCYKIDHDIDIRNMVADDDSLFGDPESLLRMEVMMAATSHPEYTAKDLLEIFMEVIDDKSFKGLFNEEKVMEIIESVLKGGTLNDGQKQGLEG